MKKVISAVLAVILAFSALAVSAAAAGGEYQTYHIEYDIRSENLSIVPVEGYDRYILPGEEFKFTVQADEGYSTALTVVEVGGFVVEPDIHGIYTISEIESDVTITLYLSMDNSSSSLFTSLIVLVRQIVEWFKNIIDRLIASSQT